MRTRPERGAARTSIRGSRRAGVRERQRSLVDELRVERLGLSFGLFERPTVVDQVVGQRPLLVDGQLGADASQGLFAAAGIACQGSFDLHRDGNPDQDHALDAEGARGIASFTATFEEQRNVCDGQRDAGFPGCGYLAKHLEPHPRLDDASQTRSGLLVMEDDAPEALAVECTVRVDQLTPERRRDFFQDGLARSLKLVDDEVGVDQAGAELLQPGRHRALPRADPTGESYDTGHADSMQQLLEEGCACLRTGRDGDL